MQRKTLIGAAVVLVGLGLWYAFRPERLFINKTVNESLAADAMPADTTVVAMAEAMPTSAGAPVVLAAGRFHTNAHETSGSATVYKLGDGSRVLRLADFATSNGPDVRVYLVAAPDVNDNATVKQAGFVELGALKGNKGDQNYAVPATVDLAKYRTVTIWCRRFSVNFGSAPLGGQPS